MYQYMSYYNQNEVFWCKTKHIHRFFKENNGKAPKFKVGDSVRILKYKNIFANGKTFITFWWYWNRKTKISLILKTYFNNKL